MLPLSAIARDLATPVLRYQRGAARLTPRSTRFPSIATEQAYAPPRHDCPGVVEGELQ
jgi:hypothetical protein